MAVSDLRFVIGHPERIEMAVSDEILSCERSGEAIGGKDETDRSGRTPAHLARSQELMPANDVVVTPVDCKAHTALPIA
jgi:hypothetical protein